MASVYPCRPLKFSVDLLHCIQPVFHVSHGFAEAPSNVDEVTGIRCWNRQSRAQPRRHRTDQIADARMRRASISFFAYVLFCIYIVRVHCPRRVFNTSPTPVPGSRQDPLIPVLPSIQLFRILLLCSQSSTSVRCLHTTTESLSIAIARRPTPARTLTYTAQSSTDNLQFPFQSQLVCERPYYVYDVVVRKTAESDEHHLP